MKISITGRRVTIKDPFKEKVEKKLSKFDRFFEDDAVAFVTVTVQRECQTVEITIKSKGMIYRAEQTTTDMLFSLNEAADALFKQINTNKKRLEKRLKAGAFADGQEEPEPNFDVVKVKKFPIKPMDTQEAILQMNLSGHQFFTFVNMETNEVNVVYKRRDGGYGLLEPTVK